MVTVRETAKADLDNVKALWADGDVMKFVGFPDGLHQTDEHMMRWMLDPDEGMTKWENNYQAQVPVDAQTGEMIVFTIGTAETLSVPEIITWDDI